MRKVICLLTAALIVLCGCSQNAAFWVKENGNVVNEDGTEYAHLANEGFLYYLGELEFVGAVKGEPETMTHLSMSYKTGMFRIKNSETDNVLVRCLPDSEWFSIYRKASLEPFDFSVDNCIRFEFIPGSGLAEENGAHVTCGKGIDNPFEIAEFLSDVRAQQNPKAAGFYDLPQNDRVICHSYGAICGFFEEEPNLVVKMTVWSYNDLAYSISMEGKEYVLPAYWLQELQAESCE